MFQTQKQQFFSITFLYFLIANAILVLQKIWENLLFSLFTNQPSTLHVQLSLGFFWYFI